MWRLLLVAAVVNAGDQFCFDHSGAPTGRAITNGQSAAILPGRAMNEIFPGGTRIVPQPSTLEENNGDGKVPPACYEGGKIPVKAPYNLKLGQCRGDLSGEELLEVCLALCTREEDCQAAHLHKFGNKDECRLYGGVQGKCLEMPFRQECTTIYLSRKSGEFAGMLCPEEPIDAAKYVSSDGVDTTPPVLEPQVFIIGGVATVSSDKVCRDDPTIADEAAEAIKAAFPVPAKSVRVQCGAQSPTDYELVYWVHTTQGDEAQAAIDATEKPWMPFDIKSSSVSTWTHERFREAEVKEYRQCFDDQGALTGLKIDPWHAATVYYGVEMLPENHPVPVPFTKSMRRDTDFFPIPDECFEDTTLDGTPENPALIRKGKHYEFLRGCLGDRTNDEMFKICMTVCAHIDFGGPGTRDQQCWGVNYDEHGFLGHCHLVGPSSAGPSRVEIECSQMDFSCQSQVLAKPFPAKPDYDQGDVDAGGGACVGPAFLTARKACGNFLNTDECGMPNQLALMCHIPDIANDEGFLPEWECPTGTTYDKDAGGCLDAPPGQYTVPKPYIGRPDNVPSLPDTPGFVNQLEVCPPGRVCAGGEGCAFDADPDTCPGFCEDMIVTNLLPSNPGGPGSEACAQLCGNLDEGVDWEATASDPAGAIVLEKNYWRDSGDPQWGVRSSGCLDTKTPWKRCLTLDICMGGDGAGNQLCRGRHRGPYCEVCDSNSYKSLDGTCVRCGSRTAAWTSVLSLIALLIAILFAIVLLLSYAANKDDDEEALRALTGYGGDGEPTSPFSDEARSPAPARSPKTPGDIAGSQGDGNSDGALSPRTAGNLAPAETDGPTSESPPLQLSASKTKSTGSLGRRLTARLSRSMSYKGLARAYKNADDSALLMGTMQFLGNARSVINFLQITAKINVVYNLTWPRKMAKLLTIVDIATLNFFSIVPFGCLTGMSWDFFDELILVLCVVSGMNLLFLLITLLVPRCARDEDKARSYRRNSVAIWIIFNFLFYMYVVGTVFTAYPCTSLPGRQKSYLTVDMSIGCHSTKYDNGVILASTVGIILYVIGIPASMFYLVYSARKNQDERALDQLSILHLVYKPNWWYTEVIVCLEKCTIAGVLVFVKDVMKQAALGLAVSGFWLFFFASAHPFRERRDNIIKDLCCLAQILVMLGVILLQIKTQSEDSSLANYSQNDIDIILIVVVCAPVAALIGPWLVHVIRNRCRALRKYFAKDADEEKKALTHTEDEDRDELGRPRLGKGPDASTTRLTLPGQDDPPARVDDADAPVEVPLQGSSPEGRGGCAVA